ncbi:pirin isoform X3 [Mustelus asterias]
MVMKKIMKVRSHISPGMMVYPFPPASAINSPRPHRRCKDVDVEIRNQKKKYWKISAGLATSGTMSGRKITQIVLAVEQSEGVGARVRRSIGRRELNNLDPFLMLDEFKVSKPAGFPDHPHRGFETVTYILSGSFDHEDFCGHKGTINPGDLQSQIYTHTPMMYLDFTLEKGASHRQPVPKGWTAFIYTLAGYVHVGPDKDQRRIEPHHVAILDDGEHIQMENKDHEVARFVLIAGEPINEPVVKHGPFVMNSQEEIAEALEDYRTGKNGFEKARDWRSKTVSQRKT